MNLWNRRKAAVIFVLMVLIVGTTLYWEETPRQNTPRWILRQS